MSAQWKISPSVDSWVALSPSTLASRIGPNEVMVARIGTPIPPVPSETNSHGNPVGAQSVAPVSVARAVILSDDSPGADSPDRSPLTSAITTGTPAAESCSARPCSVFVLPVPVAPATRPCRLTVASGIRTRAVGSTCPSTTTVPARAPRPRPRNRRRSPARHPELVAGGFWAAAAAASFSAASAAAAASAATRAASSAAFRAAAARSCAVVITRPLAVPCAPYPRWLPTSAHHADGDAQAVRCAVYAVSGAGQTRVDRL